MKKQCIKILLFFVISCSIAYLIGQRIVLPLTEKKAEQNVQQGGQQDERNDLEIYDLIANFSSLSFTGKSETDDNPWGSNLTTFEDEEHGTCILMTPGTEIGTQYLLQGQEILSWSCNIHPWMSEISDGVGLVITIRGMDKDTKESTRIFQVVPMDTYEKGSISLSEFQDMEVQLTISVQNGDNNDSSGDWLVFDQLMIQPADGQALSNIQE